MGKMQIGETVSDSASEAWKRSRKLPLQPSEEPVTAASIVKKLLLEDRYKTSSASNLVSSSIHPLRAASSLDSATHPLLSSSLTAARATTGLAGRVSPYSGLADMTNLINTSLSRSTPPLVTTLRAGKNTSASFLDQLRSTSRGTLPHSTSGSRSGSPRHTPSGYYKNMKQQLKDELKSAVEERRMLLELKEREMADLCPSSDSELKALFDLYSDVPDVLLPSAALSSRNRRNILGGDLDLSSPFPPLTGEELPPGYYKSHDLGGDPFGLGSESYQRGGRPLSSMAATDSIRVAGLSSLGNEGQLFSDPYGKYRMFFHYSTFFQHTLLYTHKLISTPHSLLSNSSSFLFLLSNFVSFPFQFFVSFPFQLFSLPIFLLSNSSLSVSFETLFLSLRYSLIEPCSNSTSFLFKQEKNIISRTSFSLE